MISSYRLAFTDSLMAAFKPRGAAARWNSEGTVMVYTSEHVALTALEILNYWESYGSLSGYFLYACHFDEALLEHADLDGVNPLERGETQAYGDRWIASRSSVVLRVPSVVVPLGFNYLLNPNHPQFYSGVRLEAHGPFAFDARVLKLLERDR